jgi:Thioredoxin like C-terminal domain
LVAVNPGTKLPPISSEASAFAKTGQPSYAGITAETYVGAERREPGTVRLEGNWHPGPSGKAAVTVMLDDKPIGEARGADVGPDGVARFDRAGMIRLVARAPRGSHVLTLAASDPGLQVYVFTFGP